MPDYTYPVLGWIVWVLEFVLLTFSFLVFYRYYQLWKVGKTTRWLPLHVWMVSGSYYLLLAGLATRKADWHAFFYVPALLLGIMAMKQLALPPRAKVKRRH